MSTKNKVEYMEKTPDCFLIGKSEKASIKWEKNIYNYNAIYQNIFIKY